MAAMTKSTSGAVTTYVITDMEGNTLTVALTVNPVTGNTASFSSSGGLHSDGQDMLAQLLLETGTGLVP